MNKRILASVRPPGILRDIVSLRAGYICGRRAAAFKTTPEFLLHCQNTVNMRNLDIKKYIAEELGGTINRHGYQT